MAEIERYLVNEKLKQIKKLKFRDIKNQYPEKEEVKAYIDEADLEEPEQ